MRHEGPSALKIQEQGGVHLSVDLFGEMGTLRHVQVTFQVYSLACSLRKGVAPFSFPNIYLPFLGQKER